MLFFKVWKVQIRSKINEKSTLDPGPVFGSIFDDFWIDFGVSFAPEIDQKSMLKFDCFLDAFWKRSGAAFSNYHAIGLVLSDNVGGPGGG